ncbi:hypothetical protein [Sorangium sp. So ce1182]|uniref:hypothetical protein n=1 Tax=Sorangium sp. So ce1182 TaxID=3133334 RepID=UPI003F617738
MSCETLIASALDWLKNSGGFIPELYATITRHTPADSAGDTRDVVWYANGSIHLETINEQEVLQGTIQAWTNNSQSIYATQDNPGGIHLVFTRPPTLTMKVTISKTGFVTIASLIGDKNYLGRPPIEFQATCVDGILTSIVGKSVVAVSLTQRREGIIN